MTESESAAPNTLPHVETYDPTGCDACGKVATAQCARVDINHVREAAASAAGVGSRGKRMDDG